MDKIRYVFAVMLILAVPPAVGLWYVIHPFARFWRRFGARLTYLILMAPVLALGVFTWGLKDSLLRVDFGTQWPLVVLGVLCFPAGTAIAIKRKKLLNQKILMGVPELSNTDPGKLLTTGIYSRVRNPRYIEFLVLTMGWVAIANYLATWILWILLLPGIQLIVVFEERELRDRFGAQYDEYCRRVPRWIPRR